MKKRIVFLNLVLLMICSFCFLIACTQKEEHTHNYKSYVYKEATCSQEGLMENLCLECGDKNYEEIPVNDEHDYEWTTIKQATCNEEGSKKGVCKNCQGETTDVIAVSSDHQYGVAVVVKASCEEGGGIIERTCTICKNKESVQIPQTEHSYEWSTIEEANCQKDGSKKGVCKDCDGEKSEVILKGEHQYIWQVIEEATCFKDGTGKGACIDCGDTITKTLSKIDHEYEDEVCTMCFNKNLVAILYEGQKLGYTLTDIENIIDDYGYSPEVEDLVDEVIKIFVKNEKVQFAYNYEGYQISFGIENIISDYVVEGQEERIVEGIIVKVVEYMPQLCVIYKDGSIIPVGYISEYVKEGEHSSFNVAKAIAINKQNQLLVVLENNYIVLLGTISEGDNNISPNILYMQTEDTFSCLGFLNQNNQQTELIIVPSHMGKVVDSIDGSAFRDNAYLENVTLSDEIKTIGRLAFYNCNKLKQIDLGKGLEKIGSSAFEYCSFEEITIPVTCTEIGAYAFYNCKSLTKIYYEGTVEELKEITFGRRWNYNVPATEVICSNGTFIIN